MKKLFLIAVLGLFTFQTQVQAQEQRGKPQKGEMLERMKEKLDLSDAQVKQIQAIDAKYEAQDQAFRERMEKLRQEHRAYRGQKRAEIEKVLTADQLQKVKTWRENRGERRDRKSMRRK